MVYIARKASSKSTQNFSDSISDDVVIGDSRDSNDKFRPITVRLSDTVAFDFKAIAAENDMSQAQLIEKFVKDYKYNISHNAQHTGLDNGTISFASIFFKKDKKCINEIGFKVQFKGEMKYADANRMYKEAIPYADDIMKDYDIDVTSGDYMLFNTVCVAEIKTPIIPANISYKYAMWESVIIASKKGMSEMVLRNDWMCFADEPIELLNRLSPYADINQRVGISFAFSLDYQENCMDRFTPSTVKNS